MSIFRSKTPVLGQKQGFLNIRNIWNNVQFRIYGINIIYCIKIEFIFSQKTHSDSNFNQKFDYEFGSLGLNWEHMISDLIWKVLDMTTIFHFVLKATFTLAKFLTNLGKLWFGIRLNWAWDLDNPKICYSHRKWWEVIKKIIWQLLPRLRQNPWYTGYYFREIAARSFSVSCISLFIHP